MRSRTQLNTATNEALAEVQAYRGSSLYAALIQLLDVVGAQHLENLADASVDAVPKMQGALSQVRQLRKALMGDANTSPIG
jgi:hypothetical protein